jgi:hypothetical protein
LTPEQNEKRITDALNQELARLAAVARLPVPNDDKRAPNCVCDTMHPDTLAREGRCSLCKVYQTRPEYRAKWDGHPPKSPPVQQKAEPCRFLDTETRLTNPDGSRMTRHCGTCPTQLSEKPVFRCLNTELGGILVTVVDCQRCLHYAPPSSS